MVRKLTYEIVYEEITNKVKEGIWEPGDKIPTVEELSKQTGVGISSVREAIRILSKQKILKVEQGSGTYVRQEALESPSSRLEFLEKASIMQLTKARIIIEPELAALAAENSTPEQKEQLLNNAKEMQKRVKNNKYFLELDVDFHELIAKASRNEVLYHMINTISDLLMDSRRKTSKMTASNQRAAHYHILIAEAIAQKNPTQARILMRSHLEDTIDDIKNQ